MCAKPRPDRPYMTCITCRACLAFLTWPASASTGAEGQFRLCLSVFPALNFADLDAAISIVSPVFGLRPVLAFREETAKVPNPRMPEHPVTAVKLNRDHPVVLELLVRDENPEVHA